MISPVILEYLKKKINCINKTTTYSKINCINSILFYKTNFNPSALNDNDISAFINLFNLFLARINEEEREFILNTNIFHHMFTKLTNIPFHNKNYKEEIDKLLNGP